MYPIVLERLKIDHPSCILEKEWQCFVFEVVHVETNLSPGLTTKSRRLAPLYVLHPQMTMVNKDGLLNF